MVGRLDGSGLARFAKAAVLREKAVRAVVALPRVEIETEDRPEEEGLAAGARSVGGVAVSADGVREWAHSWV